MSQPVKMVLSRWEHDPPAFVVAEQLADESGILAWMLERKLLCSAPSIGEWDCEECGEVTRLIYLVDRQGITRAYATCRCCGPMAVPDYLIDTIEVKTPALLAAVFAGQRASMQTLPGTRLWQVGTAAWAGRLRRVWFSNTRDPRALEAASIELSKRPKTIVFVPTVEYAVAWRRLMNERMHTPVTIVALEECLTWSEEGFVLDEEFITAQIVDSQESSSSKPTPLPKRAVRAAKIEKLRKAIVEHIRSACDHAISNQEWTGEPELLPRPTQDELARQLGITKSDVSRCLKDPSAKDLRMLWESAVDVHEVMKLGRLVR